MTPSPDIKFHFDPFASGLEKFAGPLEAEILAIIWDNGPIAAKRVQYFLNLRKKYAYTTVSTVLTHLVQKGFLNRQKKSHSFLFHPVLSREQFLKSAIDKVLSGLIDSFPAVTNEILKSYKKK